MAAGNYKYIYAILVNILFIFAPAAADEPIIFYGDESLPPFEFLSRGEPTGMNVELLRAIGAKLGRPVEFRLGNWAASQQAIAEGKGHALSFIGRTPEREAVWDFSDDTFVIEHALFMRTRNLQQLGKLPIEKLRIGVQAKGLSEAYLATRYPAINLVSMADTLDGMRQLARGEIDAFSAPVPTGLHILHELGISGVAASGEPFVRRAGGVAVSKSVPGLRDEINAALRELRQDGTYDRIVDAWSDSKVHLFSEGEIRQLAVGGLWVAVVSAAFALSVVLFISRRRRLLEETNRRLKAEAALWTSEQTLGIAQEAAGLGTWDWDPSTGTAHWSPQMYVLLGLDPAPPGPPSYDMWLNAVHPDDRVQANAKVMAAADVGGSYKDEFRVFSHDGGIRWVAARGTSIVGADGKVVRVLGIALDVTERLSAIDTLNALNADLERKVEERSAQLVKVQKMEAIGQLTSGMAHDFNNVLQGIASCLGVLQARVNDPSAGKIFRLATDAVDRGARLTQHLLAFARRQSLHPCPTALGALLEDMKPLLERTMGGLIAISIDADPAAPPALVDPTQLELAIINLAINARDAMPDGGTLSLRTGITRIDRRGPVGATDDLAPGDYATLTVADTGIGMDETTQRRVFEPFFTTKEAGKGSGLGLAMVHGMAAQSGGGVALSSRIGEGTAVTILLPRAVAAAATECTRGGQDRPSESLGGTVLVVDDDPLVRGGVTTLLVNQGYVVVEAADGEGALDCLASEPAIQFMVADFAMPGMNGAKLIREAKRLRPDLPCLLMTGHVDIAAQLPDVPILRKPFKADELSLQVSAALQMAV